MAKEKKEELMKAIKETSKEEPKNIAKDMTDDNIDEELKDLDIPESKEDTKEDVSVDAEMSEDTEKDSDMEEDIEEKDIMDEEFVEEDAEDDEEFMEISDEETEEKSKKETKNKEIKEAISGLIKAFNDKVSKLEKINPVVEESTKAKGAEQPKADEGDEGKKEIKTHVKSSSKSLSKKAMNKDTWSINSKEIEDPAKIKDAIDNFSIDKKEVNKESLKKPGVDSDGARAIKDLYNKLQPASDEYSISFDKKSALREEIEQWKKRVAELERERQDLIRKQQEYEHKLKIKALSEEMFKVVSSLKAKNLIEHGAEEDIIEIISNYFADEKLVEGLNKIASYLKPSINDSSIEKTIPQIELNDKFEVPNIENEDEKLIKAWVLKTLKNK